MSEPIVLESNQNHATITSNGICPALSAPMCLGGGYVPMIVESYGIVTKGNGECWLMPDKHTSLTIGGGQAGQGYPCALVIKDDEEDSNRSEFRRVQGE